MAPTWTLTNVSASAPRKRCRLSSHAGVGRRPSTFVARSSPHTIVATISAHETRPLARATYHGLCETIVQLPLVVVCEADVLLDEPVFDEVVLDDPDEVALDESSELELVVDDLLLDAAACVVTLDP